MKRRTPTRLRWLGIYGCSIAMAACTGLLLLSVVSAESSDDAEGFAFAAPVRFMTDSGAVRVERPGYASPCWADIDDDGKKDLLVGQFNDGKIRVFKSLDESLDKTKLAEGEWLQAEGSVAKVPGVW